MCARWSPLYAKGHVPTAINIPVGKIVASKLAEFQPALLVVVYCAGPHCNGADRAAIRLARFWKIADHSVQVEQHQRHRRLER